MCNETRSSILAKLVMWNRTEMIWYAIRSGLVEPRTGLGQGCATGLPGAPGSGW